MGARWITAAVAAALASAAPARAQRAKALRLEIGGAEISTGYYCARDIFGNRVCSFTPFGYGSLVLGAAYDSPLGGTADLTFGGRVLAAGAYSRYYSSLALVEPTLGLTWKFALPRASPEPRLHAGLGLYLGSAFGAALRLGAGLGLPLSPELALGFDVVLEVGSLGGYGTTAVSFTLGPEFRL